MLAGALELCLVADLEEIGLPRLAIEQIMIHFGKAVPVPGNLVWSRSRCQRSCDDVDTTRG